MRIVLDDRALADNTGIGRYAKNLIKALPRVDSSDEYVLMGDDGAETPSYGMERVRCREHSRLRSATTAYEHVAVPQALQKLGADIFHAMFTYVPILAGCRKVFTLHDLTPLLFPQYHRRETVEYLQDWTGVYIEAADIVITDSEYSKTDIARFWPAAEEKTYVVLGAADARFRPRKPRVETLALLDSWGVTGDYILSVGTLEPRKNIARTIQAYKRLRDRCSDDVTLVLIGMHGWGGDAVEGEIAQTGTGAGIVLPGHVDDETLVDLYNGCLFFVYPSIYEGFGLPPLEALSCGKAAVVSSVTSLPEVVGDAALLVDPLDVEDISAGMEKLLTDCDCRKELERRAPTQAQKFSWETSARKLKILYRMLT